MDPKLAPAIINPKADFAVSTFVEELTKAQKSDTPMLPKDSIAQYDIHPETEKHKQEKELNHPTIVMHQASRFMLHDGNTLPGTTLRSMIVRPTTQNLLLRLRSCTPVSPTEPALRQKRRDVEKSKLPA